MSWTTRFARNSQGSIALKAALVLPAILMMGAVAFDLIQVQASKNHLQDIADSAALAGADALSPASSARQRARTHVESRLGEWGKQAPSVQGLYKVVDVEGRSAIQVVLKGHRPSLFGDLLPPGGWRFDARSTATTPGMTSEK
jgi:Flp pilus assembly protein TadG